jgi:hypothetical protein
MTYNLHVLMSASCEQLHECLRRVVFTLQHYKLLQVLPADDDGNSSGRRLILVMCCPLILKVYMTALLVVRLTFNFTACTFMETVNFKVPLKS